MKQEIKVRCVVRKDRHGIYHRLRMKESKDERIFKNFYLFI